MSAWHSVRRVSDVTTTTETIPGLWRTQPAGSRLLHFVTEEPHGTAFDWALVVNEAGKIVTHYWDYRQSPDVRARDGFPAFGTPPPGS